MSFFGKLFGKKTPPVAAPSSDPAKDPNMIRVFDAYGREMFITKQVWRDSILLDQIKKVWNDAPALYQTIVQALQDGFGADMIKPAEQLAKIDPDQERGAVVLAIVYREQKRLEDSERVLRHHIERHGQSGVVLTNLAKVQADQGHSVESLQTLWHGLELDPNQDNGMGWYTAIFKEKEGEAGYSAALKRVAALPRSWRAHLWLAREALLRRQLDQACTHYDAAFAVVPRPVPTDMLQQVSGDLGNQGHLPMLLKYAEPHFDLAHHGLAVGNNLIKANLDLGRLDAVRKLLDQHYALKRMDWKETLAFWDSELAKAHVSTAQPPPSGEKPLSIAMLVSSGPVWLPEKSPANELFVAPTAQPLQIGFLGSSAETKHQDDKPRHQMSDGPGRLARALPLFLSEQVYFGAKDVAVQNYVPWLQGENPAFVLSGVAWTDENAVDQMRGTGKAPDYAVVTHINATADKWNAELRLIRVIDRKRLATTSTSFPKDALETALSKLAQNLLQLLVEHASLTPVAMPALYGAPSGNDFGFYMLRLEQLLAVRCSALASPSAPFLTSEREILDGDLQLCLSQPSSVVARILFIQTLTSLNKFRGEVVAEYREKVLLLQKEKPLAGTAHLVLQRMVADLYSNEPGKPKD